MTHHLPETFNLFLEHHILAFDLKIRFLFPETFLHVLFRIDLFRSVWKHLIFSEQQPVRCCSENSGNALQGTAMRFDGLSIFQVEYRNVRKPALDSKFLYTEVVMGP